MQKWEYKQVEKYLSDLEINKLGYEGWELVGFAWYNGVYRYVFKRPV